MGIKYDKLPAGTSLLDKVSRDLLASRGIRTGTRPIVDLKGRVTSSVSTVSFGNPVPQREKVFRDEKGRVTRVVRVIRGFSRN